MLEVVGGSIILLMAWITYTFVCEEGVSGDECGGGLLLPQFLLALGGAIVIVLVLVLGNAGRHRLSRALLLAVIPVYLVWAVLNDAAVHGWGSDMTLVP